jgi:8-oxo-dGTP diphosphatase
MKLVTAAIIQNEGKYFIARRGPSEKLAGYWEFPGGKVEDGESLSDCLQRELIEELGISSKIGDVLITSDYVYEHGHIQLVAMAAEIVGGKLNLTVHDQYDWLSPIEILKLNLAPADVPVAQFLLATNTKKHS